MSISEGLIAVGFACKQFAAYVASQKVNNILVVTADNLFDGECFSGVYTVNHSVL